MAPEPGLTAGLTFTVGDADTAEAVGSGDVPVLATPRLLAFAEEATVAALRGRLEPGQTSVGTRVVLDHRAAGAVGAVVAVTARLAEVDGRRLVFDVEAREETGDGPGALVGTGRIERAVVDRARFLSRLV